MIREQLEEHCRYEWFEFPRVRNLEDFVELPRRRITGTTPDYRGTPRLCFLRTLECLSGTRTFCQYANDWYVFRHLGEWAMLQLARWIALRVIVRYLFQLQRPL